MFDLIQVTPTGSDCTAGFKIEFKKECTVLEFVSSILTRKDWGYIEIKNEHSIEYRGSKLLNKLPERLYDLKIKSGKASGGYSRMDYYLEI